MAANTFRPGRPLAVLVIILIAMAAWLFWPFSDASRTPTLGLDLRGGTSVTLKPVPIDEGEVTQEQIDQAVEIIRQRVDSVGVAESQVTSQGSGADSVILVSVPGVNQSRLVELVGQTAQLNFRPVLSEAAGVPSETEGEAADVDTELPIQSAENDAAFQAQFAALDCLDEASRTSTKPDDPEQFLATCSRDGGAKYLLEPSAVLGTNIEGAEAQLSSQGVGQWVVTLDFDAEGTRLFAETTAALVGQPPPTNQFAIVLDGLVVSAPSVNEAIPGGTAEISGSFTQADANDLANVLKFGALPLAFEVQEVSTVSATLGNDQLNAGLIAGGLGILLVVLYLLFYYRLLGIVASASLLIAAAMTYMSFVLLGRSIGFTLTLAGVAGAIIAIGITADSFIVYFERIRDELREGKTLRVAAEIGWSRARRTILAADFVSLLAAVVLYAVSVGNVRGFAFALGLTTLIDIAVVFLFTRPIVTLLSRRQYFAKGGKWSGLASSISPTALTRESTRSKVTVPATAADEES